MTTSPAVPSLHSSSRNASPHPRRLQTQHLLALLRAKPRQHFASIAPPGGAMSPADVATLIHYAARYHITVVPEQEAFGHLHHVLEYEQYSSLAETPHGQVLSPRQPGSLALIKQWFTQITRQFPSPWVTLARTKPSNSAKDRTKDLVTQRGLDQVYVDFLRQIDGVIRLTGKRVLFWGDLAWHNPDLVAALPKDMIGVPGSTTRCPTSRNTSGPSTVPAWRSGSRPASTTGAASTRTTTSPGQHPALRPGRPANGRARYAQHRLERRRRRHLRRGLVRRPIGAAASWQSGESPLQQFESSYGAVFHGDLSGKIDKAQGQIMAAQKLLSDNGFRFGASNTLFWKILERRRPAGLGQAASHPQRRAALRRERHHPHR